MTRHMVQRIAFDFEVATQSDALSIQDRLSSFRLNRLEGVLEACFADVQAGATALRLDRLDLDLGDLPRDDMESVLAQRLGAALRDALRRAGADANPAASSDELETPSDIDDLAALELYLQHGVLHWSLRKDTDNLDALLTDALARSPERLRLLLHRLGPQALVRRRLAYQAGDAAIERLAGLLAGRAGETLAKLAQALRRIHRSFPLTRTSPASFAISLRSALLETLFASPSADAGGVQTEREMLQRLAEATGLRGDDLLAAVRDRARLVPEVEDAVRSHLDAMANARAQELGRKSSVDRLAHPPADAPDTLQPADMTEPGGTPPLDRFDSFLFLIRQGAAPPHDAGFATRDMAAWVDELLAEDGPRLLSALREIGEHPATADRLLHHLPWSALETLILRLAPEIGGLIASALMAAELAVPERSMPHSASFRLAVWRTTLGMLLDPQASKPNARSFLAATVQGTAARSGEACTETLSRLLSGARAGDASAGADRDRFSTLVGLLSGIGDQIPREQPAATPGSSARTADRDEAAVSPLEGPPLSPQAEAERPALDRRLLAFLRYGALPSGDAKPELASMEADLLAGLRKGNATLRDLLLAAAPTPLPRARLVRRLKPANLRLLIQLLHPAAGPLLSMLDSLAQPLARLAPRVTGAEWSALVHDELLIAIGEADRGQGLEESAVLRGVLQRVAQQSRRPYPTLLAALSARLAQGTGGTGARLGPLLDRLTETAWADTPLEPVAPVLDSMEELPKDAVEPTAGPITYIDNAGLVLLWPFLTRYFTILALLGDEGFRSMAAQVRAVHLTEFLVSGDSDVPEHRLALNKVLCGLPPAVPTDRGFRPTTDEVALSENLLRGVTQSWAPLENTSIESLRETFLRREGRLSREGDASLSLQVDSKPYDMLLDRLPWSISVIRLSFMTEALHVRWR